MCPQGEKLKILKRDFVTAYVDVELRVCSPTPKLNTHLLTNQMVRWNLSQGTKSLPLSFPKVNADSRRSGPFCGCCYPCRTAKIAGRHWKKHCHARKLTRICFYHQQYVKLYREIAFSFKTRWHNDSSTWCEIPSEEPQLLNND